MGDAAEKRDHALEPANDQRALRAWYTTAQAAEYLGTSAAALHMLIKRGRLVPDKPGGRGCFKSHRFARETLDALGRR